MRMPSFHVVMLLLSTTAGAAAAGQAPAVVPPEAADVEDVIVVGTAIRRTTSAYVRTVGAGPAGRLSPRWRERICVQVVEMDVEHATFLKSRIEAVAAAVGVSTNPAPTCRPNIVVYASEAPADLARSLTDAAPRSFRPFRRHVTLGDAALETFRTSDDPLRWWQVSLPVMAESGQPAMSDGVGETRDPTGRSVPIRNGSRLSGTVRDDLRSVTIIMDTRKAADLPFGAVADYVAFVALAPVDPRVDTGRFDTVLNLFDQPGVAGLTAMDQDYLYALYTASRAPASASLQAAEIMNRMAAERERRHAAGGD